MKLKTHICKKTPGSNGNGDYLTQNSNITKTNAAKENSNNEKSLDILPLSCVDWSSNDDIYFVSDDHQIYKWSSRTRDSLEVAKLPDDFISTDMHWLLLGGRGSGGGKGSDTLLISSNDGRFIILNKSSRVERSISAHTAAISSGRWSPDGAGLLTAGEDGVIKIWSRSGMLRSTILQSDEAIRCARWSPNSSSIVFCQGGHISVKPLAANSKLIRWRAHDGLVLSLSWSAQSNIIASGGEDFRFKIWDYQGANLFISSPEDYAITSVAFNPEKDVLLVSTFNMLKLCSSAGWTYSTARFNEPSVGSFHTLSWSSDGTQVACGTSTGQLIIGYIVQKQLISKNLKATTTGRKSIRMEDIANGSSDALEFTDRVINFGLDYGHLIVATSNQIHIYNEKYINTPIIIDGRTDVRVIEVGKKFFMVLDSTSIWVYTFTGRLHLNPRYPGSQAQIPLLNWRSISLGLDTLVIRDNSDNTALHIFDLIPGATRQYEPFSLKAKTQIAEIAACRAGTADDQFVVMIDSNRELYITETRNLNGNIAGITGATTGEVYKIGTQVTAVKWASESNILVGVHDACYSIWYCPGEGATDPTIIALTTITIDATEFGKNIVIETFEDAIVTFRCSGALLPISINMYCEILHRTLMESHWQQALKICRMAQNAYLWATLAAVATRKNQLQISEEAYSAALQIDKVSYLQYIKTLEPSSADYMAENSLMLGRLVEAETILIHNRKYREAVCLCMRMHNWRKALEIAQKHDTELLQLVLQQRMKYLTALGREEWDTVFLSLDVKDNNMSE
ncbi:intraflagellar transport protein 80 homolog [Calliphora vicina]|uniref:intraflagellar transport protein 80 homolog n=1 Tax=Calliphora vicina TaxID=7373 RepID=UPI00325AFD9B